MPENQQTYKLRHRGAKHWEVTVPIDWVRNESLKEGDVLKVEPQEDGTLVIRPVT